MDRAAKVGLGSAAVSITFVVAGAVTLWLLTGDGDSTGQSPTSSSAPAEAPFGPAGSIVVTSDEHAYRVHVPEDWTIELATASVPFEGLLHTFPNRFDSHTIDAYKADLTDRIWVASGPIERGVDLDVWIAAHLRTRQAMLGGMCGPESAQRWRQRIVADLQARERSLCGYLDIVVAVGDRIYLLSARSARRDDLMATFLDSIEFQP